MPIKSLSDVRRLPRLGCVRLGIKVQSEKGAYPKEVDYFVLDPNTGDEKWNKDLENQFKSLYGEKPKSIDIMFPPVPPEMFFSQWRKRYGSGALLKCKGDGDNKTNPGEAVCGSDEWAEGLERLGVDERGMVKVKCLGEDCIYSQKRDCNIVANLQVILPKLNGLGIWQISTGSYNSIVNINSAIDWLRGLCGRYAMIPVRLMRQPQEIAYEGKKRTHYILAIDQQTFSLSDLQQAALIEPTRVCLPEEVNTPELEDKTEELVEVEEVKKPNDMLNPLGKQVVEWLGTFAGCADLEALEKAWNECASAKTGFWKTLQPKDKKLLLDAKDSRKHQILNPADIEAPESMEV